MEQGLGRGAVTFAETSHPLRSKDFNTIDKDLLFFPLLLVNPKHFRHLSRNSNFIIKTHSKPLCNPSGSCISLSGYKITQGTSRATLSCHMQSKKRQKTFPSNLTANKMVCLANTKTVNCTPPSRTPGRNFCVFLSIRLSLNSCLVIIKVFF